MEPTPQLQYGNVVTRQIERQLQRHPERRQVTRRAKFVYRRLRPFLMGTTHLTEVTMANRIVKRLRAS